MIDKKNGKKSVFKMISDIISWTVFALLMLIAAFLIYYVIANNVYASKGERFRPIVSLYTIISGSMLPTIQVYDVVVNQRIDNPDNLKENDVITFISQSKINYGETITHRIIKVTYEDGKYYYTTKGDNNLVPDETPVEFNNVIGKVVLKIPQLGKAQFFLLKQGSKLFLILIPAFGVLIYDLLKMLNLFGTKKKVDESLKTKEYKLTKEEEENLKNKIKERLISNNDNSYKEESKLIEIRKEDSKEENKSLEESKEKEQDTETKEEQISKENIEFQDKEVKSLESSNSTIEEPKLLESKNLDNNIKTPNKNKVNQTKKKPQQRKNFSSNTNNNKKKTTSKKTNSNSKAKKDDRDIDVDKVLEKIKEKKY